MKKTNQNTGKKRMGMGVAAALVLAFTVGLNTSETFAMGIQQLPVIGTVGKVLTVRNYDIDENGVEVKGEVLEIQAETAPGSVTTDIQDEAAVAARISEEIQKMCDTYVAEAQERADEYKKAFLATGGTEEEWKAHNIQINVDYEVKNQTVDFLSFVVNGTENWNSAGSVTRYYNLNLKDWSYVTLEDMLGENYKAIADDSIKAQMETYNQANPEMPYWTEAEGGFAGVTENTNFYINEKGKPVVVFDKYEVGPGAMGKPEFEIVK